MTTTQNAAFVAEGRELVFQGTTNSTRDVPAQRLQRKDHYEVLGVSRTATVQEIKKAYNLMALKHHPDKNGDDQLALEMFLEVQFSYSILSDDNKRRQYDRSGFEAIKSDRQKSELDLSHLNPASTMCVALLSKLGVPIKTIVPVTILDEALKNRSVKAIHLHPGQSKSSKVEKLSANFYSVDIQEQEDKAGFVCRVQSTDRSKFKLLYFTREENGGLDLALQEDSVDTGKDTSAGMYFLGFPVYRFEHSYSAATTKNSHAAFFKMLDSYQPCDINELKPGTHYFAVYGDNFFNRASYTIEFVCAQSFSGEKKKLQNVEEKILARRAECREVFAKLSELKGGYTKDMQTIEKLLKERNEIHASFTTNKPPPKQEKQKKAKDHALEGEDDDSSNEIHASSTTNNPRPKQGEDDDSSNEIQANCPKYLAKKGKTAIREKGGVV